MGGELWFCMSLKQHDSSSVKFATNALNLNSNKRTKLFGLRPSLTEVHITMKLQTQISGRITEALNYKFSSVFKMVTILTFIQKHAVIKVFSSH